MQSMEGIVTIAQEGRFQFTDRDGVLTFVRAVLESRRSNPNSFRRSSVTRRGCAWTTPQPRT